VITIDSTTAGGPTTEIILDSGIVLETGRPIALHAEGDGGNHNSDIHHDGLSDAFAPPHHDIIGSRIDNTLVMSKSKGESKRRTLSKNCAIA